MTLDQVIREVDHLDKEDFRLLVEHIEQRQKQEWVQAFDDAVEALQEGLTEKDVSEMVQAMNAEYIKPMDDAQWRD